MEEVKKGPALRFGRLQVIPIEKWTRLESRCGPLRVCYWTKEPLGIQVLTSERRYALDLDGQQSEELLRH